MSAFAYMCDSDQLLYLYGNLLGKTSKKFIPFSSNVSINLDME